MTSKQRAYLKGLAMTMDPILQLGKEETTKSGIVLTGAAKEKPQMAEVLAERTRSQIVQVIGKKIVLYREGKNEKKKIELPRK